MGDHPLPMACGVQLLWDSRDTHVRDTQRTHWKAFWETENPRNDFSGGVPGERVLRKAASENEGPTIH